MSSAPGLWRADCLTLAEASIPERVIDGWQFHDKLCLTES